jgi:hypothetical protein
LTPIPKEINDENLSLALQLYGWDSEDGGNGRQTTAKREQIRLSLSSHELESRMPKSFPPMSALLLRMGSTHQR